MIERNLDSQVEAFIIYDKEDDSPHTIDNVNAAKENQVTTRVSPLNTQALSWLWYRVGLQWVRQSSIHRADSLLCTVLGSWAPSSQLDREVAKCRQLLTI